MDWLNSSGVSFWIEHWWVLFALLVTWYWNYGSDKAGAELTQRIEELEATVVELSDRLNELED